VLVVVPVDVPVLVVVPPDVLVLVGVPVDVPPLDVAEIILSAYLVPSTVFSSTTV
jgi:hypothetical protein